MGPKLKRNEAKSRQRRRSFAMIRAPYRHYKSAPWRWIDVFHAVEHAGEDGVMTQEDVAKSFGINPSTLSRRYKRWVGDGRKPDGDGTGDARGRKPTFAEPETKEMAKNVDQEFVDKGVPFTDEDMAVVARRNWLAGGGTCRLFKASNTWVTAFKRSYRFSSRRPTITRIASHQVTEDE